MADALAKKPSRSSGLVMPPGGRIGSNEELGIEPFVVAGGQGRCGMVDGRSSPPALSAAAVLSMGRFGQDPELSELSAALGRGDLLDLNGVSKPEQLLPFLQVFQDESQRGSVAARTFDYLATHRPIPNVGVLARLRVGVPLATNSSPRLWCARRDNFKPNF